MAEARDTRYEDATADGGGGYGKFRKRPFRRTHATPYDRPPSAVRNLPAAVSGANKGWLSRLVDPARRLIAASAHRLLSSVKRLPPPSQPPPQPLPPEPETNQAPEINRKEAIATESHGAQEASRKEHSNLLDVDEGGGVTELERLLKQKTFTKSDIDRLTALLQSRIVDQPGGDQDQKFETFPSKVGSSQDRNHLYSDTPIKDGALESRLISAPNLGGRNLPDEDVASPAELTKAYMGSMPSKRTPVPRAFPENGILTPRSRGRSAIFTMARTPYSRKFQLTSCQQGVGTTVGSYGGPPSSSHNAWKNSRSPASTQGTLKRRSSVLDNDIGALGPIRRIHQKSNLLPASGVVSDHGVIFGVDSAQHQPPKGKEVLPVEPSIENRENGNHGSGFISVPSKSSEMASRIFQQLGVLVSSREKSPTKLSPSMLRGPALRSLETLDSSKFFETLQESNRLDVQHEASFPVKKIRAKIEENGPTKSIVCEKSTPAVGTTDAKSWHMSAALDAKKVTISVPSSSPLNPPLKKQAFQMTAQEDYLAFDDCEYPNGPLSFKLPDVRGNLDTVLVENKSSAPETSGLGKPSMISEVKSATTSILRYKTVGTLDGFVASENSSDLTFPVASVLGETGKQAMKDKHLTEASGKATLPKELAGVPSISVGDGVVSVKESNGSPSFFKFAPKPVDQVSQFAFAFSPSSSNAEMGSSSRLMTEGLELEKPDQGDSLKDGVLLQASGTAFSASSTVSVSSGIFSFSGPSVNSTSMSNGSLSLPLFSSSNSNSSILAAASATVSTTSGSSSLPISASAPSFSADQVFKLGSPSASLTFASSAAATTTSDSTEANAKGPSSSNFSSTPVDGSTSSSLPSTGSTLVSSCTTMTGTGGTLGGTPSNLNTGSSIFGSVFGTGPMTSTTSNQPRGVTPFTEIVAQSSTPGFIPTSVESLPKHHQSNSSASSLFGLAGNTSFSSGSSLLTSSTSNAKLFSSGPSFMLSSTLPSEASSVGSSTSTTSSVFGSSTGTTSTVFGSTTSPTSTVFGSSTSPTSSVFGASTGPTSSAFGSSTGPTSSAFGSSTGPTSSVFGSSWQTPKSPVGAASSISTSTGLVFGSSATSSASTPVVFGSSISATASFPFTVISSASAPLQSMFGNSNTGFTVGSSPSSNGDQMNMEDNMAEDTVQVAPPTMFGQQPMPTPSPGFVFGSPSPSGLNQFGAPAPSGASPFQFGGQPNVVTPANPSLFQASGSLEFNAGGSFSPGTSGGDKSSRRTVKVKRSQRKK